jgi:predicted membrane chloride channel (bestrophin family)
MELNQNNPQISQIMQTPILYTIIIAMLLYLRCQHLLHQIVDQLSLANLNVGGMLSLLVAYIRVA